MNKNIKKIISFMLVVSLVSMIFTISIIGSSAVFDLSDSAYATGNLKDDDVPVLDTNESTTSAVKLPSSVDLSKDESFPCVGDQGSIGSCTAWASTYYQFGYQVAAMNSWNAKNDTTKQFSPKWTYNFINGGGDNGSYIGDAYELLKAQGAVRYSEFMPTEKKTEIECSEWCLDKEAMKNALIYRISDYKHLSFSDSSVSTPIKYPNTVSLSVMKSLLNSGNVLTFTTDMTVWDYEQLYNQYDSELNNQYVCIKQVNSDNVRKGHAMAIVGYDDDITYDLDGDGIIKDYEKGAFKIVNSWGTDYKNDGFVWIMYDALNKKSNADVQNVSGRQAIFEDYSYYTISVEQYSLDLTAEVTITQSNRGQFTLDLSTSSENKLVPDQGAGNYLKTLFWFSAGTNNFNGLTDTAMQATFVFDYGKLCNYNIIRKNYYLSVEDSDGNMSTIIDEIKLIDYTGKIVVDDTERKIIRNETVDYRYKIGMVGDIDNDGVVSIADATLWQKYMAGLVNLTKNDTIVADVNNDVYADINDVTYIQKYLAGLIDEFDNGHFALLN